MPAIHENRFPDESDSYREKRDELLRAEIDLRRQIEDVAALRRQLPDGGALKEDYLFAGVAGEAGGPGGPGSSTDTIDVRFSELFADGKDTLILYSFMYPIDGKPCPACTAFLDSLNANALHIGEKINIAVAAKSPVAVLRDWAQSRGWKNLRMLSSGSNSYNADYFAESPDGAQFPLINVFRKSGGVIRHFYCPELFFAPPEPGQHPRHIDLAWPLWAVLDMTPGGRPDNWFPTQSFEQSLAACKIG